MRRTLGATGGAIRSPSRQPQLCIEMGVHQRRPTIIYQDCEAAQRASLRHRQQQASHKEAEVFVEVVER
jgi:hypothetical protein